MALSRAFLEQRAVCSVSALRPAAWLHMWPCCETCSLCGDGARSPQRGAWVPAGCDPGSAKAATCPSADQGKVVGFGRVRWERRKAGGEKKIPQKQHFWIWGNLEKLLKWPVAAFEIDKCLPSCFFNILFCEASSTDMNHRAGVFQMGEIN